MPPPTPPHGTPPEPELAGLVLALLTSRQSVMPVRLHAPGPSPAQLHQLVEAAACAPDHRGLRPWRLIEIGAHQRDALADVFEACAQDRQPPPSPAERAKSRDKAYRAPTLLLAVLKAEPADPEVPLLERAVALGAALMGLLLAAHGLGFGASLTSGRAVRSPRFAQALQLAGGEQAVCFVAIGQAGAQKPKRRSPAQDWLSPWAGPAAY